MKRKSQSGSISLLLVLCLLISIMMPLSTQAAISHSESIRIGLFYRHGSRDTTLSDVNLSSVGGVEIGISSNGNFIKAVESGSMVIASKDHGSNAYHIRLTTGTGDIQEVNAQLNHYASLDFQVFPVYSQTNQWLIYEGSYQNHDAAQSALVNNIRPKIGEGDHAIIHPSSDRLILKHGNQKPIMANESQTGFLTIRASQGDPKTVNVNGKRYRGSIELRTTKDGNITVINELTLEEYVYGVVPLEIGVINVPNEALKAQAVAARTYALHSKHSGFDLCNTVCCQVYGGYDVEHYISNQAVDATRGIVATYGGNKAVLYYFSSSGGYTENSENVWFGSVPYLKSVADPYESVRNWSYSFTTQDLTQHMNRSGKNLGEIKGVEVLQVSQAGRVLDLLIVGTQGSTIYSKDNIRNAFPTFLPSLMFSVGNEATFTVKKANNTFNNLVLNGATVRTSYGIQTIQSNAQVRVADAYGNTVAVDMNTNDASDDIVISGSGHGHGVGMSQSGARGMAEAGYTYQEILKHYYTGIQLEEIQYY